MEKRPEISLETLADYAFENLSPEQEANLEALFDTNEHYALMVDELLDYCLAHQISSKEQLLKHLEFQRNEFIEKVGYPVAEMPLKSAGRIAPWQIWVGIAALIALILAGYWILFSPQNEKQWDTEEVIMASVQEHRDLLVSARAVDDDWKSLLISKSYRKALELLQAETDEQLPSQVYDKRAFFLGVLTLYLYYDQAKEVRKAIPYLEVGRSFDEPRAEYHLLNAYILSGQKKEAEQLLTAPHLSLEQLPEYVRQAYLQLN